MHGLSCISVPRTRSSSLNVSRVGALPILSCLVRSLIAVQLHGQLFEAEQVLGLGVEYLREDLVVIPEGFELQRVARRIADEHGRVFPWFSFETDVGRIKERVMVRLDSFGQDAPRLSIQI